MPYYQKLGQIPPKRHITFYKSDGKSLYREEHASTLGFSGVYSNKYHIHEPTRVLKVEALPAAESVDWKDWPLECMHFETDKRVKAGDFIDARVPYLTNSNCTLSAGHPNTNADRFYRNAYAHELIFVHMGFGTLRSEYGDFPVVPGDQIIVPKGVTYQLEFDKSEGNKIFVVESDTPFDIPKEFRNGYGQLTEDAPYCERDFKTPQTLNPRDEMGEFTLLIKGGERMHRYTVDHHPFDIVGWDGYLYPFAFNIKDYAPKVGKLHLPPPVHLAFRTGSFVYCNFCPRLFDWHPQAIPAPYFHSNVDSCEVLYYVDGDFMSRTGVGSGSVTLHPTGVPHGPQPGKTESSIGTKETHEYALMVDTFYPLHPTTHVRDIRDKDYVRSWLTN